MRKKATFTVAEIAIIEKAARLGFPAETAIAGLPSHSSHAVRSLFGRLKASAIRERGLSRASLAIPAITSAPVPAPRVKDVENPAFLDSLRVSALAAQCNALLNAQERVYGVWPGKAAMLARAAADTAARAR